MFGLLRHSDLEEVVPGLGIEQSALEPGSMLKRWWFSFQMSFNLMYISSDGI